jgi:hypothetical protein
LCVCWPRIGFVGQGLGFVANDWIWWPGFGLVAKDWVLWPWIGFGGSELGVWWPRIGFVAMNWVWWPRIGFGGQASGAVAKDLMFVGQGFDVWWPRIGFLGERRASEQLKTRKRGSCQKQLSCAKYVYWWRDGGLLIWLLNAEVFPQQFVLAKISLGGQKYRPMPRCPKLGMLI